MYKIQSSLKLFQKIFKVPDTASAAFLFSNGSEIFLKNPNYEFSNLNFKTPTNTSRTLSKTKKVDLTSRFQKEDSEAE